MEQGLYNIHIAPLRTGIPELETDEAEIRRFCQETKTPLFYTNVNYTELIPGISEKVKKPYIKYFAFCNGAVLVATEKGKEAKPC